MLTRDTTYLDPPEAPTCDRCDEFHDGIEDEIPWCSCRCHWDAEDHEIERLRQRGEDV